MAFDHVHMVGRRVTTYTVEGHLAWSARSGQKVEVGRQMGSNVAGGGEVCIAPDVVEVCDSPCVGHVD